MRLWEFRKLLDEILFSEVLLSAQQGPTMPRTQELGTNKKERGRRVRKDSLTPGSRVG
jgi:hypothetical protein